MDSATSGPGVSGVMAIPVVNADESDWYGFDRYLWAAYQHPSEDMTLARNEGTVDLLIDVADPAAAGVLRQMVWWNPEGDDTEWADRK